MRYYFQCPDCESDVAFSKPREGPQGLGCLFFLFINLIPLLRYVDARRRRVQCRHCGYIFRQPPLPRSSASILSSWVIGIVVALSFLGFVMASSPGITAALPSCDLVDRLAGFISENPKPVAYALLPMLVLVLAACFLASWVSDLATHKKLREEFLTRPGESREDDSPPKPCSETPEAAQDATT